MNNQHDFTPVLELLTLKLEGGSPFSLYDLMRWLQEPEQAIFHKDALTNTNTLFKSHFILMHCLYLLRKQWADEQHALLSISALHIQKYRWPETHSNEELPNPYDSLSEYYLDLNELDTSEEDIERLLKQFWQQMLYSDHEAADLTALELTAPVTADAIRLNYRRLAMRHHPDRGGDEHRFREIQTAYQRLRQRYS